LRRYVSLDGKKLIGRIGKGSNWDHVCSGLMKCLLPWHLSNQCCSSVMGLCEYKHEINADSSPKLYFVKMDIKAAFDTIKQDKMLEVVSSLLDRVSWSPPSIDSAEKKDHDYCLMLYCLLLPPASKASQGSARRLFKQRAVLDGTYYPPQVRKS